MFSRLSVALAGLLVLAALIFVPAAVAQDLNCDDFPYQEDAQDRVAARSDGPTRA